MRGPGQGENPQFGCKVDNKYDAIADSDDPFEAIERLNIAAAGKDAATEKTKGKAAGEKAGASAVKKAADGKKDATGKPQSAGGKQDTTGKKPVERGNAQERPKTAGDKPARADNAQQGQRRPRGGAAPRGGALPQQAGVVGLTTNVPVEATSAPAGEDEHADGFQQQQSSRVASAGNRGRRGGPRGAPFGGPAPGGFRRPRGFGGPRYGAAPAAGEEEGAAAQAGEGGAALNESGETEERLDRNFERRGGRGFGGYRGNAGYARRGGFRRGPAAPGAGFFEDGTGRKREFERHSGSDVTGVRPVDKREGSGAHNWGTARDDLAGQTETITEGEPTEEGGEKRTAEGVKEAKAGEAWTDLVNADESAKAAEGESGAGEQDKMYVLDDWKAKEEKERFRVPEFNVRKPNEGVDATSKWGGFILKKREDEEAEEEEIELNDDELHQGDSDDAKRKGKQRLNIPVKFANAGFRGGRGGRGAGSGRGGFGGEQRGGFDRPRFDRPPRTGAGFRGGFRGERGAAGGQGAPSLTMDEFPSLNKQAA